MFRFDIESVRLANGTGEGVQRFAALEFPAGSRAWVASAALAQARPRRRVRRAGWASAVVAYLFRR